MSERKAKAGNEPSFALIGDKVELLLNFTNEHNDYNRCLMALNGYIFQDCAQILLLGSLKH